MSTRRKLAIATWDAPREGNIYGKLSIDATEALRFIDHLREKTGQKITITHLVGKACAMALQKAPGLNGRVALGRFVPYPTVDVAFLVTLEGGSDLAKVKVCEADRKSTAEIAEELNKGSSKLRKGEDADFEKSKGLLKLLPTWLIRPMINLVGFLSTGLGIELKALGLERFPFGTCIITNVGMFGLDEGFAPPTPFARVPVYVLMGAVKPSPWVVEGELTVRPVLTITATIDHRFIDGFQGGVLARVVRDILENPWQLEPELAALSAGDDEEEAA